MELEAFGEAIATSTLPDRAVFDDSIHGNWSAALRQLAGILPEDRPSVVVIDEVPYLMNRADAFEGILQRAWDRDDLTALQRHRAAVTDQPVPLVAVSRSGVVAKGLDAAFGPADLIKAWQAPSRGRVA